MKRSRFPALACLCVLMWIGGAVPQEIGQDPQEMRELVSRLGDSKLKVRQEAQAELVRIGTPAIEIIKKTLETERSPEILARCRQILRVIRWRDVLPPVFLERRKLSVDDVLGMLDRDELPSAQRHGLKRLVTSKIRRGGAEKYWEYLSDPEPLFREAAMDLIVAEAKPELIPRLADLIRVPDQHPPVISGVVVLMTEHRIALVVPDLVTLLKHPNDRVRFTAAWGLGILGDGSVAPALMKAYPQEKDETVREAMADSLTSRFKLSRHIDPKEFVAVLDQPEMRDLAIRRFTETGDARALPGLRKVVLDEKLPLDRRLEAARICASLGDRQAIAPVEKLLEGADHGLHAKAAAALGDMAGHVPLPEETVTKVVNLLDEPGGAHDELLWVIPHRFGSSDAWSSPAFSRIAVKAARKIYESADQNDNEASMWLSFLGQLSSSVKGDKEVSTILKKLLEDPSFQRVEELLWVAGSACDPSVAPRMAEMIGDRTERPGIRYAAYQNLVQLAHRYPQDSTIVAQFIRLVGQTGGEGVMEEYGISIPAIVLQALAGNEALMDPSHVPALVQTLMSVKEFASSLENYNTEIAASFRKRLLNDRTRGEWAKLQEHPDSKVKEVAKLILNGPDEPPAEAPTAAKKKEELLQTLQSEGDLVTRVNAARDLSRLGEKSAVPIIRKMIHDLEQGLLPLPSEQENYGGYSKSSTLSGDGDPQLAKILTLDEKFFNKEVGKLIYKFPLYGALARLGDEEGRRAVAFPSQITSGNIRSLGSSWTGMSTFQNFYAADLDLIDSIPFLVSRFNVWGAERVLERIEQLSGQTFTGKTPVQKMYSCMAWYRENRRRWMDK